MAIPVPVRRAPVVERAMPKSVSLTTPAEEMRMLAGLISRWITPRSCAKASAESACRA